MNCEKDDVKCLGKSYDGCCSEPKTDCATDEEECTCPDKSHDGCCSEPKADCATNEECTCPDKKKCCEDNSSST